MAQDTTWGVALKTAAEGPQPLPPGTYDFRCKSAKHQKASSGRDMIVAVLEVVTPGPLAGKTAWNNFVLQPEREVSMGYFFSDMAGFGLPREWFAQTLANSPINEQSCTYIAQQLPGRYVKADVKLQANDSSRNDIKNFRAVDNAPAAPPPAGGGMPAAPGIPQIPQPGAPQFAQPSQQFGPAASAPAPAAAMPAAFQPPQMAPQPQWQQPQPQWQPPQPAQQPQQPTAAQDPWVTGGQQPPSEQPQQPAFPPAEGFPQPGGFPQAPVPQAPAPQAPQQQQQFAPPITGAPVPQPPPVSF